ncbi:MAG: hypothetical protein ACLQIB_48830 [Isosphaeraceae bacterium]
MPQVGDGQLAERTVVALQREPAIQDARRPVGAGDALEFDSSPSRCRGLGDLLKELLRPPPQGDKLNLGLSRKSRSVPLGELLFRGKV